MLASLFSKKRFIKDIEAPSQSEKFFDLLFIVGPQILGLFLGIFLYAMGIKSIGILGFFIFVVCIDVSHVYSTLFRTYLHRLAWQRYKPFLILLPIFIFTICYAVVASIPEKFWTIMAYLAIFHFIRQQYGLVCLYEKPGFWRSFDGFFAHLFPFLSVLAWHFSGPKAFFWFAEGDFILLKSDFLFQWTKILFAISIAVFLGIKLYSIFKKSYYGNQVAFWIVLSTAINWWVGIIVFDSDVIFTISNVVAHGIPYLALIWKKHRINIQVTLPSSKKWTLLLFILFLVGLGLLEEGLWDFFVYQADSNLFPNLYSAFSISAEFQTFFLALLSVPQVTHYLLDGFIWKKNFLPES